MIFTPKEHVQEIQTQGPMKYHSCLLNNLVTVINASAAVTLLEQRPEN